MNSRSPDPPRDPAGVLGTRAQSPIGTPAILKCPSCGSSVQPELPFCGSCGGRITSVTNALACPNCGRLSDPTNAFCPACGTALGPAARPATKPAPPPTTKPSERTAALLLLDRAFKITNKYPLHGALTTVGRQGADINFPDDGYLSPVHAQFVMMDGILSVRDLGSRNGTWVYLEQPHRLVDGDQVLIGSQVLRYKRLGYPGPRPPEQDQTRRLGSLTPSADIANLAQIRADGSARDIVHLSPGRSLKLGREQGEWQFPYDASMSGMHAHIRSEDADFVISDAGSRNGVAVAVRGERQLQHDTRLLVGDQLLRVEMS